MNYLRLSFCAVLFALAATALTPGATAAAEPGVQPPEGAQGSTFSFVVAGFAPKERVSYWLTQPDGQTTSTGASAVSADENGQARWTWTAPQDAAFGTWTMVGFGNTSRVSRQIAFTIRRPETIPAQPAQAAVEPAGGSLATTFAFTASGFAPNEQVSFWASSPHNAAVAEGAAQATADQNGRVAWQWSPPDEGVNATPGIWLMVAYGNTSQLTATVRFTVAAPPQTTPSAAVQPSEGTQGTEFTFTVEGLAAEERVSFWVAAPNKAIIGDAVYRVTSHSSGRATWTWTAPKDAVPGTWIMVGFGNESRKGVQIPFTIK